MTITGTLYKTTTLMEAFYFGGMAESILSGVTIGGLARLFVTNTWQTLALWNQRRMSRTQNTMENVELVFCIVRPRDSNINGP